MRYLRRPKPSLLVFGLALILLLKTAHYFTNIFDLIFHWISPEVNALPLSLVCNLGRLGNQMCTYATLLGVSALNHRRPISLSCNINHLKNIFVGPSRASTKDPSLYIRWHPWKLKPFLKSEDAAIPFNSNFLDGYLYPCSYTFFEHLKYGIRKEFQFHDRFNEYAQTILHKANFQQQHNITFVGVHVRRGDYKKNWLDVFEGVPVNVEYFRQAFHYFRTRYNNVIFIGVSDNRAWIKKKLSKEFGVHVSEESPSPAHDLAILANCNHTIMTYGTFGFWGAYLAGGEVLYFDKFLKPNTTFTAEEFVFDKMYPPYWKGLVTVDASLLFKKTNTSDDQNVTDT